MAIDEEAVRAAFVARQDLAAALFARFEGRVVGGAGDSLLAVFPSVVQAVRAAFVTQRALRRRSRRLPAEQALQFRIGVNVGDVLADGVDVYGHSVNLAARVQGLAEPGGVTVSQAVVEQIRHRPEFGFRYGGMHRVKNLPVAIHVYHVVRLRRVGQQPSSRGRAWRAAMHAIRLAIGLAAAVLVAMAT